MRFTGIDQLRAAAALMVFAFHALGVAAGRDRLKYDGVFLDFSDPLLFAFPLTLGWCGVTLFFVISGFCIHISYATSRQSWAGFAVRRFFRIYPAYFAAMLIFAAINRDSTEQIVAHALLVQNFRGDWYYGINASFWSIAVEAQLYALYPLVTLAAVRFGWRKSIVAILLLETFLRTIAGSSVLWIGQLPDRWLIGSPFYFLFAWCAGAFVGEMLIREKHLDRRSAKIAFCIFLLLGVTATLTLPSYPLAYPLFSASFAALLILSLEWKPRPILAAISLTSYSIYLLHQPILKAIPHLTGLQPGLTRDGLWIATLCLFAAPIVYACSWIFFHCIERPANDMGKQLARNG